MSRPIDDSGASCQPTVTLIMSTPHVDRLLHQLEAFVLGVAAPAVHQLGAVEADDQRIVGRGFLDRAMSSRMKRPRFSVEPPYSSVRWLVKRELNVASR